MLKIHVQKCQTTHVIRAALLTVCSQPITSKNAPFCLCLDFEIVLREQRSSLNTRWPLFFNIDFRDFSMTKNENP